MALTVLTVVEPGVARRDEQRALGRAAPPGQPRLAELGLVAEHDDTQRQGQPGVAAALVRELRALPVLALADAPGVHGHAVLGERARLVRADDRDGAEAFDGRQAAPQRPAPPPA